MKRWQPYWDCPNLAAPQRLPISAARLGDGDLVSLAVSGWAERHGFDRSRASVARQVTREQADYLVHRAEATAWMLGRMLPGERIAYYPTEPRGRLIEPLAHGIGLERAANPWVRVRKPFAPQAGIVHFVALAVTSDDVGGMAIIEMVAIGDAGPRVLGQL